jgi:hypothetical protein
MFVWKFNKWLSLQTTTIPQMYYVIITCSDIYKLVKGKGKVFPVQVMEALRLVRG